MRRYRPLAVLMACGIILAGLLALAGAPAAGAPSYPVVVTQDAGIVRLECFGAGGQSSGTAVHLGAGRYVTAAHVLEGTTCQIGPNPIAITHFSPETDFAMFDAAPAVTAIAVSCAGFRPGEHYLARGYAFGHETNAHLPWIASYFPREGRTEFVGDAIPGMSGGPVLDRKGRVVGVVLQRLASAAIPLSSTPVCA